LGRPIAVGQEVGDDLYPAEDRAIPGADELNVCGDDGEPVEAVSVVTRGDQVVPSGDRVVVGVAGTVLEPGDISFVSVLFGLRRQSNAAGAKLSGVRIVYAVAGMTYEVVQPWSFEAREPGD
jgi:hypothetical protein